MDEEKIINNINRILKEWQEIINIHNKQEREIEMSLYLEDMPFYELQGLLDLYNKEKEKNKNKDKILRNIREEFLKYDWKNANPIQTYNQIKSLYESIYCKPYED